MSTPPPDPDLDVEDGAFEAFAEFVVATVLGADVAAGALSGAVDGAGGADGGAADGAADAGQGSVLAGEGGDALYTMPDGSISFSGSSGFGDSYSFDAG